MYLSGGHFCKLYDRSIRVDVCGCLLVCIHVYICTCKRRRVLLREGKHRWRVVK